MSGASRLLAVLGQIQDYHISHEESYVKAKVSFLENTPNNDLIQWRAETRINDIQNAVEKHHSLGMQSMESVE